MKKSVRSEVNPFLVMDTVEKARLIESQGRSIVHMEIGQPSTPAPQKARDAVASSLDKSNLGYTVSLGLPELRQGIASLYKTWYGVEVSPERVVITNGSSSAFILALTALFDAGERVAIGEPGYASYRNIFKALSLETVGIQTAESARFQPTPADLEKLENVSGLLVASPSNPTGTILSKEDLSGLIHACHARGIRFISDEIYHGLCYGERKCTTALEVSNEVYVINSFSKFFSMTGWRVGWMVVPQNHIRTIERLAQNLFICAPHVSQVAALGALNAMDELGLNVKTFARNRELMVEGLPLCGFTKFAPPDGAFYIYASVEEDSLALCAELLEIAGVAVTSGLDFDPLRGDRTIRFSYAGATHGIVEGLSRLKIWHQGRQKK